MRKPHKIIFLNGPRGSGKDTAANFIIQQFSARHYKMARPLKNMFKAFFGLDERELHDLVEKQKAKIVSSPTTFGFTPVEVLISLSEDWAKPKFGDDIFGQLAVRALEDTCTEMTVISDSGFRAECIPIIEKYKPHNCLLIHLHRNGCTFDGDSRSYIDLSDLGVTTTKVNNVMDLELYRDQMRHVIKGWDRDA